MSFIKKQKNQTAMVEEHYARRAITTIRLKMPYFFPIYLIILQLIIVIVFSIFGAYKNEQDFDEQAHDHEFSSLISVHIMILVGFALLMTFLKQYSYSSIGFTFLLVSYALQWSLIVKWIFKEILNQQWVLIVSPLNLLEADYCVVAVLVSFGVLVGKISLSQVITMATIEVVIQCFNEFICTNFLMVHDVGHSMSTFTFGVFFGLSVSIIMHFEKIDSPKEDSSYVSNTFSLLGTLVLWLYWPQFNSTTAYDSSGRSMAGINTFLAMMGSCTATFITCTLLNKGKLNTFHIRNATIAGGVAIGSIADLPIQPFGALLIGLGAGMISSVCYQYTTDFLKKILINDTCGIFSLFGVPSIISGILSGIIAASFSERNLNEKRLFQIYPARNPATYNHTIISNITSLLTSINQTELTGRTGLQQGSYQILALLHTICAAILFGIITGIIIKLVIPGYVHDSENQSFMFDDEIQWILPTDNSLRLTNSKFFTEEAQELVEQKQIETTEFVHCESKRGSRSRQ